MSTFRMLVLLQIAFAATWAFAGPTAAELETVTQAYSRVTGLSALPAEVLRLAQESSGSDGRLDLQRLYERLFADRAFVDNRLATFTSALGNEEAEPFEDVDDYQVSWILAITSGIDVRLLLSKPYFIESVDEPGKPIAPKRGTYAQGLSLRSISDLPVRYRLNFDTSSEGAPANGRYGEGLLTTQGFGARAIKDGTNRRAIRAVYDQLLCTKIEAWKDATLDDFYVGNDVDRKPGDNPETYQTVCRGCHAPMDAQRGALAHYDYDKTMDMVMISESVVPKFLQNSNVFSDGVYVTRDARWENLLTDAAAQAHFGWRGGRSAMTGRGLLSFSTMIANARQFQTCLAQRIMTTFCERSAPRDFLQEPEFKMITDGFRDDGYNMKKLIQKIVSSPLCKS